MMMPSLISAPRGEPTEDQLREWVGRLNANGIDPNTVVRYGGVHLLPWLRLMAVKQYRVNEGGARYIDHRGAKCSDHWIGCDHEPATRWAIRRMRCRPKRPELLVAP
jgi:hypothetical protein